MLLKVEGPSVVIYVFTTPEVPATREYRSDVLYCPNGCLPGSRIFALRLCTLEMASNRHANGSDVGGTLSGPVLLHSTKALVTVA